MTRENEHQTEEDCQTAFDDRVIKAVRQSPNLTLRSARLATILGISIDEANAELCGLLSAVGGGENGATFTFEDAQTPFDPDALTTKAHPTMVFTFPKNFEQRARSSRRRQDLRNAMLSSFHVLYRALKVLIGFGLILSLVVTISAALMAMVAAVFAMASQRGERQHQAALMRRMRSLLLTLRELLWCYAVFGGVLGDENSHLGHPFLRELSGTLAYFLSVMFWNPFHPSFWFRTAVISRRQRRLRRGWGDFYHSDSEPGYSAVQGSWGQEGEELRTRNQLSSESFPGLLSVVVEFLFGPTPFSPGPSCKDKWRQRALVIASRDNGIISVRELLPYVDYPPDSSSGSGAVVSTLYIISHFNGVPVKFSGLSGNEATFCFPELVAESETGLPSPKEISLDNEPESFLEILYAKKENPQIGDTTNEKQALIPRYLKERKYILTSLQPDKFGLCIILGMVNYFGIHWLKFSISPEGAYQIPSPFIAILGKSFISLLAFYAKLFFLLPLFRLLVIVILNKRIDRRNFLRSQYADELTMGLDST